jgi:hypothetical protein
VKKLILLIPLLLLVFFAYKKKDRLLLCYETYLAPPPWAEAQLNQDLCLFSTISQESLDKTFKKIASQNILAYRYRIINGAIYRQGRDHPSKRALVFDKMLKRLRKARRLPNVDFLICMMDGVPESYAPSDFWIVEDNQAPLLAWAKKESAQYIVLVPDVLTTLENSWDQEIAATNREYKKIPWSKRAAKAFWRGTASDKTYTLDNYREKPRFLLSWLSKQFPKEIDAGFCKANEESLGTVLSELGLLKGHVTLAEHLKYKYLPVLDGWMCTYPGYQWRLFSGSLTMKQDSDEVQYFYKALKPYVHYLPVQNDMSDLLDQLQWAKDHDERCQKIAENARSFAESNLTPYKIYAYLFWTLERYGAKQNFDLRDLREETKNSPDWTAVY